MSDTDTPGPPVGPTGSRVRGLDGLRGIAALFVVLHHCWLLSFPGFPRNTGPDWVDWLLYGHFAVAVFIVLSGFSLAIAPAARGWQLGGARRFLRRRAWRILPPYWAALVLSTAVSWAVVAENPAAAPTWRSLLVFGGLAQDVVHAPSPNSAFWSIAVEAQLYLLFPLLLLLRRRWGAGGVLAVVTAVVVTILLTADRVPLSASLLHLTPEFAVLFTLGMVAAGVQHASRRRLPDRWWPLLAGAGAVAVGAVIVVRGSEWTVGRFPWVDLALAAPIACLLVGLSLGRPHGLLTLLASRPLRSLGSFSFSLYLVHVPIVVTVRYLVGGPPGAMVGFLLTTAIAVPAAVIAARLFAAVFELPFVRYRSVTDVRAALTASRGRHRPDQPRPDSGPVAAGAQDRASGPPST